MKRLKRTDPIEFVFLQLAYSPTPIASFGRVLSGRRPFTIGADVFDPKLLAILREGKIRDRYLVAFEGSDSRGVCQMQVVSIEPVAA
jgi:hypothetical protein